MNLQRIGRIIAGFLLAFTPPASATPRDLRVRSPGAIKVARSQFNFEPFKLRNICLDCSRNSTEDLYGCTMKFDWFDPNSVKENNITSCSCKYNWNWDGETMGSGPRNSFDSQMYSMCQRSMPTFFEMRINEFHAVDNFTLSLGRRYKDTVQFVQPYVYPTAFAEPAIKLTNGGQGSLSIQFFEPGPVHAVIQGLSL